MKAIPHRGRRFGSIQDGLNRRKTLWMCGHCLASMTTNPKKTPCIQCGKVVWHFMSSKKEAARYTELFFKSRLGEIRDLVVQPKFPVRINGKLVFTYRADFQYTRPTGAVIVEDVKPKGFRDRIYLLKKKAVEAAYGIKIHEVEK